MKNKVISLLLALVTIASLVALTACSNDTPPACEHPETALSSTYEKDATNHWKKCTACQAAVGQTAHTFVDGACSVCGYTQQSGGGTPGGETVTYPWKDETLKFEISDDSNGGELSSLCRRYMAGTTSDNVDIDVLVDRRNSAALRATNISKIDWVYLPGNRVDKYGWGVNTKRLEEIIRSKDPTCPDIFCSYVYDLTCLSIKGWLKNLNSESDGTNYFEFAMCNNPDYQDKGVGYMYDYMWTLTLSREKMYLLSSDYFTDMVRAFYVIPVNSFLMNNAFGAAGTTPETAYKKDRTGDGKFDIKDFFKLIEDKEWNYETMAKFCFDIKQQGDKGDTASYDLQDRVGFALDATSGLCASGMLYTTSITIINRVPNNKGDYDCSYPERNPELVNFCTNLATLFGTQGVISVKDDQTYDFKTEGGDGSPSDAIRNRFTNNTVLFGNIVCLGAVEEKEYQEMNGGFGIAPVPLYRTSYTDGNGQTQVDDYLTQIHNLGRIGAISGITKKFSQCSAYLNYQSLNSNDIINMYYNVQLKEAVQSGENGDENVAMLKYIREHVRTAFDKTFEDAVAAYAQGDYGKNKWHEVIKTAGYIYNDMSGLYERLYEAKQDGLNRLKNEYEVNLK